MPRRAFSSETAQSPAPGRRYMVRRDETLWQIASRGRPEGISVQQAMLDIQRLNPEAFIDGNINRIKAGYIIYLPAQGDISSDDLARALSEVRQQNADWAQGRGTVPGVTAAASLRISADPADADAAATRAAAGAARDVAESTAESAPSTGSSATVVSSSGDAEPAGEPSDTATASAGGVEEGGDTAVNSELAAQLDRMASRLDSLEQIVAVKDEQIASLEAALREAREAADAAPAVAAPELPRSGTRSDAAAEARAPKPEAGLPGWLRHWPYAAGAALILALLGLLVARRRRDAGADPGADSPFTTADDDSGDDVFAGVTLRDEPLAASDAGAGSAPVRAEAEPEKRDSSPARDNRGYGERRYDDYIDDAGTGDALAEADIYIAYGRYLQAAELLNTAMTAEPENPAYRLKLMELYVDMGEPARAREQLEALRALGDEDSIARAEAILGDGPGAGDSATVAPPAEWERVPAFPSEPEFEPASEDGAGALSQTEPELRPEPETEPAPEPEPDTSPEPELETRTFPESESLGEAEPEPESAADPELEVEPESSPESESRTDREPELELEPEMAAAAAWQGNDEPAPDDAESELELDLDLDLEADHAGQDAAESRAQADNRTAGVGAESPEVEEID
jgi:pilus assembly protein FimV